MIKKVHLLCCAGLISLSSASLASNLGASCNGNLIGNVKHISIWHWASADKQHSSYFFLTLVCDNPGKCTRLHGDASYDFHGFFQSPTAINASCSQGQLLLQWQQAKRNTSNHLSGYFNHTAAITVNGQLLQQAAHFTLKRIYPSN